MATQAALIADTIMGMKKALRRENEISGPDSPITQPTNRGNKLKANAQYVHEGVLGYTNPLAMYKEEVDHAGYKRYILQRNPPRYDSEGDELDDDDVDSEADAAAAEENPFAEVALEHFLCPLKHPSELPNHPSMSQPYTSKALKTMTKAVERKLWQERNLLWRARNLHRLFLGDSSWMPCGKVETPEDKFLFEPRIVNGAGQSSSTTGREQSRVATPFQTEIPKVRGEAGSHGDGSQDGSGQDSQPVEQDVEMADVPTGPDNDSDEKDTKKPKSEDVDAMVTEAPSHGEETGGGPSNGQDNEDQKGDESKAGHGEEGEEEDDDDEGHGSSPEPPRRMTTRAQTNAANPQQENGSSSNSPSPSDDGSSAFPGVHPLFLVPEPIRPDPNFGLPPNEAEDTRRLLWSYIQKQEETVRGFEHMLESLLKACRMKEDVFEWCKAEGHLGEMSDGEDWYDREKWGLAEGEDLKKGADEDEVEAVDETRTTGKRGRGRRQ
ncbi:hypothetical protein Plec18167_000323 [Paecilomyces lecythidis]|uniref:Transcriptional regulatory protein RXT2 N-terminal domain-containing protein n=1 Tax=Paecilomyces lecythidis TaxID=3004212 RepID=A0ABR3YF09_9EURO